MGVGPSGGLQSPQDPVVPEPWWKVCLTFSIFTFASSDLEGLFQSYLATSLNLWTFMHLGHMLMGWIVFSCKFLSAPQELRDLLPPVWVVGLVQPLMGGVLMGIMLTKPAFHAKHRQALYASLVSLLMLSFRSARVLVLWIRTTNSKAGIQSWLQQLQSFSVENLYFALMWLIELAYPLGQVPALVLTTLFMLMEMSDNSYICSLSQWSDSLITLSPKLLAWTKVASAWISGVADPHAAVWAMDAEFPCPAALALWQLVGWWFACHVVFAAEILRRRAFLRTHAALAQLGSAHEAAAMAWPFGRLFMVQSIVVTSLALSFTASTLWSVVLQALA